MPVTQFDNPIILGNGDLDVTGTFTPDTEPDTIVGDVVIRWVLVQEAVVPTDQPAIVNGVATLSGGAGAFQTVVPKSAVIGALRTGVKARAVGMAVYVKSVAPPPPPAPRPTPNFETATWCVDVTVT